MNILNEECFNKEKYMRIPTETAKNLYFYTEWAGAFECKKDFYIHRGGLNSYLLLYTISGTGFLSYKNRDFVITPGSVTFLDCRVEHKYFTQKAPWKFKYIHFNGNLSDRYCEYINHIYGSPVFSSDILNLDRLFDKAVSDAKERRDEAVSSEHIYKIITSFIYNCDNNGAVFNSQKVMEYISDNYMDITDIGSIAALFNFSRSHFTVRFKKATGITPYDYLTKCRISAAKQLLTNTNRSIEYISEACGFGTYSSFIRAFKSKTGLSPIAYKRLVLHTD